MLNGHLLAILNDKVKSYPGTPRLNIWLMTPGLLLFRLRFLNRRLACCTLYASLFLYCYPLFFTMFFVYFFCCGRSLLDLVGHPLIIQYKDSKVHLLEVICVTLCIVGEL